ncbi:substrate-binding domain-containing protein [Streptomyces wuyuanensis]|uniref:substrate-binding domain-containing protein n=1 Tax=Streptomyces wuyuanensis TaxID=1196353 RepID=UPI003419BA2B
MKLAYAQVKRVVCYSWNHISGFSRYSPASNAIHATEFDSVAIPFDCKTSQCRVSAIQGCPCDSIGEVFFPIECISSGEIVGKHVDRRHERVLALVREERHVRLTDLAEKLGISVVTARRDVDSLAETGLVVRSHGVASWPDAPHCGAPTDGPLIGMIVPSLPYYFSDIARSAQAVVEAAGGRLTLTMSQYCQRAERRQVQRMLEAGIEGLLITPTCAERPTTTGDYEWLTKLPVPAVLVERAVESSWLSAGMDRVRTAVAEGCALAVRHLVGLGHQRIALLHQPGPHSRQIKEGFQEALATLDLWRPDGGCIVTTSTTIGYGPYDPVEPAVSELAAAVEEQEVTAVLVHNDQMALAALALLQERDIHVPDRCAIVSYDDEVADMGDVPLSALAPRKRELGAAAAELVLGRVAERRSKAPQAPVQHLELLPDLRVRNSCGADTRSHQPAPSVSTPRAFEATAIPQQTQADNNAAPHRGTSRAR